MDLSKRLAQIVSNNGGLLLFIKLEQPATGWVTVRKVTAYTLSGMTADSIIEAIRSFLITNMLLEDGVAVYRRAGVLTLARISYHQTQLEATLAARSQVISHIVDVATNTAVQVGDYEPNTPGDGGV